MSLATLPRPAKVAPEVRDPAATARQQLAFLNNEGLAPIVAQVKFFNASNPKNLYGFAIPHENGQDFDDVFLHIDGCRVWAFDGGPTPALLPCNSPPREGWTVILLNVESGAESADGKERFRSNEWVISNERQYKDILEKIANRKSVKMCDPDGTVRWEGNDIRELRERFPLEGEMIQYPTENYVFQNELGESIDDPRIFS